MINVLIVEDDPMIAEFNKRYLSQIDGFELVDIANSFKEALSCIAHKKIDLILLDIFMPGMNGLDLLGHIREIDNEVDVIIVTAACDIHTIKKAMHYGVVDYLIKPFEFERFNTALSEYKETQRFINERQDLSQEELDQHIFNKDHSSICQLPKGLDKNTLKNVWTSISKLKQKSFSTEEIAKIAGISRVSMRKYLDFLKHIEVLSMNVEYGSVGRPIYKYRCISSNDNFLNYYI